MQLQYTMTRRDLRDQFAALGRTRGSLGARYVATNRLMMALVFAAALGVSGWRTVQRAGGLNAVAAATLAVLTLLLAVFLAAYWALAPRLFASVQLLALRAALDSLTAAPYTLQLADGQLHYQGPSLNAGRGALDCAVTGLRAVRRDKAGLVVIFADGSGALVPNRAFSGAQELHSWLQALQPQPGPVGPSGAAQPAPADGFVPDDADGGVLACTLDAETTRRLLWELNAALLKTPVYWRRLWWAPLLLAVGGALLVAQGVWWLLPVLAVIVVWAVRRNARSTAARLAGHSVIRFGPDAMQVETGAGGRFEVPYRGLTGPYRTAHGIFLYDPAANVARVFPRAALTPESEAALWTLLCRKTGREV